MRYVLLDKRPRTPIFVNVRNVQIIRVIHQTLAYIDDIIWSQINYKVLNLIQASMARNRFVGNYINSNCIPNRNWLNGNFGLKLKEYRSTLPLCIDTLYKIRSKVTIAILYCQLCNLLNKSTYTVGSTNVCNVTQGVQNHTFKKLAEINNNIDIYVLFMFSCKCWYWFASHIWLDISICNSLSLSNFLDYWFILVYC